MWPNPKCSSHTAVALRFVAVLLTVGEVHCLKCRTPDHSRRQGEFTDMVEQCNNGTADRSSDFIDSDYLSSHGDGNRRNSNNNSNNNNNNRRNADDGGGRRNNNREFSVRRQEFGDGSNNNNNNNNRGNVMDYHNDRGNEGNRNSMASSCDYQPQQYLGHNNRGRPTNQPQGNTYSSMDYDAKQPDAGNRQPNMQPRRYRRRVAATNSGNNKFLGNNRFRNVTKNGSSQIKGSILDKMDACTIHCVFNQLEMLNSNARPDKSSMVNIMTNQIKDVELKEFIQDSIDECFDTLELDSHNNKCEFTKNFAICMENKAQKNCDDWEENNLTNNANSAQSENNQQDKRRGY